MLIRFIMSAHVHMCVCVMKKSDILFYILYEHLVPDALAGCATSGPASASTNPPSYSHGSIIVLVCYH
jgi:hypothetical protein